MSEVLDKAKQNEILSPAVLRLMGAINSAGAEARVVGGSIRDAFLNRTIGDIDLAANIRPEEVIGILSAAGIKTIPTGLAHGTITAVIDHIGYEITTLRQDVETDGRHARVSFTDDWRSDAARRDFTFNALYLDQSGKLYDYFGGVDDALNGRVRFIGGASARIQEDYLRILRFFRFTAWFAEGQVDAEALNACREHMDGLAQLSAERIAHELIKLLTAPKPLAAWQSMRASGALSYTAPQAIHFERLQKLLEAESLIKETTPGLVRLAALVAEKTAAEDLTLRLKLSNKDSEKLRLLSVLPGMLVDPQDMRELAQQLYSYGSENTKHAFLIKGVSTPQIFSFISSWKKPIFPLKGEDILKRGVTPGIQVGDLLRNCEAWWIAGDFKADRQACLDHVDAYIKIENIT